MATTLQVEAKDGTHSKRKKSSLCHSGGLKSMRLTEEQSRGLLAKHGVYVTEACDGCGKILGHVRFTRKDQPGEWCSRECRDGVEAAERYRATRKHVAEHATGPTDSNESLRSRKGGRPRKYRSDHERQIAKRRQDATWHRDSRKHRSVEKNPPASDSFHVSTGAENRPPGIPIAGERV